MRAFLNITYMMPTYIPSRNIWFELMLKYFEIENWKLRMLYYIKARSQTCFYTHFFLFLDFIKDSARPSYWVPDYEISQCHICKAPFGPSLQLHHCRDCGQGVCAPCSSNKKPVPKRNWEKPVRVCDQCYTGD